MNKVILSVVVILALAVISLYLFTRQSPSCEAGNCKQETKITSTPKTVVQKVSATQFKTMFESDDNAQLIDIRTASEYNEEGHISTAKNIDYYSKAFRVELDRLDKAKTTYVYCRSGNRSASAVALMQSMGFTKIVELDGGILSWSSANFPLVKTLAD